MPSYPGKGAFRTSRRLEKIRRVLEARQKDLTLVLENIHDPHNVSAIYRSSDAFGVSKVCLYYTNTAFPHLAEKSSASARKWVETERYQDAAVMMAALREQGMAVYATGFSKKARPLGTFDLTRPTAFVLGNEHEGVSPALCSMADAELYIPMFGMIQSFNVSVAGALVLYEACRQRMAAGLYDSPSYEPEEMDARFAAWAAM